MERCAVCEKAFWRRWKVIPPKEVEITVWMWYHGCWKCARETPVVYVSPDTIVGGENIKPDWLEELPEEISKLYPFFRRVYSKTLGMKVWGNICVNCETYQGNHFVMMEALEIAYDQNSIAEKRKIRITLTEEERSDYTYEDAEEILKSANHHISYEPESIISVCANCHRMIHYTDEYPHLKPNSK